MYPYELLIEFHEEARTIKEHQWYEHHEPDPPPMLVVRWRDMAPQSVDFAAVGAMVDKVRNWAIKEHRESWVTDVEMGVPLVLFACLGALEDGVQLMGIDHMPEKGTPIESIWLATEGYSIERTPDEYDADLETYERGDLQHDFKTNPASKVLERLTTYIVETSALGTAEWARITSAFHKDDGGRIVWHDPMINTSEDHTITGPDADGFDRLLNIMIPHVTREKLA